jgi:hypothetical protein
VILYVEEDLFGGYGWVPEAFVYEPFYAELVTTQQMVKPSRRTFEIDPEWDDGEELWKGYHHGNSSYLSLPSVLIVSNRLEAICFEDGCFNFSDSFLADIDR